MSDNSNVRTPAYRLHKATGQAIVSLNGKMMYLGLYGTETSKKNYDRLIAEWLANGRYPPDAQNIPSLTVGELVLRYWNHAQTYYVKNGNPTSELSCIQPAVRPLNDLYSITPVIEFGPLSLKAVRQRMIEMDHCRNTINNNIDRIKRLFRWGVSNELVPPGICQALAQQSLGGASWKTQPSGLDRRTGSYDPASATAWRKSL